ncbi:TetR/AcrR family transcriptional regulator, partial [Streptomyces albidoflavus]|uniref:TetR/AcrR family transcriptional regulator n=1 Tax=Streptomyces albidoflavus TaxID=1886 RepID=UPI0020D227C2
MDSTLQERARATRRSLLEAAALLFAEQGYAGTSVNDISARSGRTSGAVYFHYASKEGLALAVVQHHFATWPGLAARYTDRAEPPLEKLVALSFDIAHALAEDPLARAGARLWAERDTIDAPLPDPFALWTTGWTPARSPRLARAFSVASSPTARTSLSPPWCQNFHPRARRSPAPGRGGRAP